VVPVPGAVEKCLHMAVECRLDPGHAQQIIPNARACYLGGNLKSKKKTRHVEMATSAQNSVGLVDDRDSVGLVDDRDSG
jgi:hypothetical protein